MSSPKEKLLDLRKKLAESLELGITNPEVYHQQLIQILVGIENSKIKSQKEVERLKSLVGEEEGRIKAFDSMADLIVGIIDAFINQEKNRIREEAARAKDLEEIAEYAKKEEEEKKKEALPPGVKIISKDKK